MTKEMFIMALSMLLLTSCVLQDQHPIPQNYSSTKTQQVNSSPINQTNTTNVTVEPPKPILLPINDKLAIYILDTKKKGTSIVTLNKKAILVNAQGSSDGLRLIKILKNLGYSKLEYLIATNGEENNINGFPQIILRLPPKILIHSGILSSAPSYSIYKSLYKSNITLVPHDDFFLMDELNINLIVPYDDGNEITPDDSSVVVKLSYGDNTFLLTTDCAIDCESRISNSNLAANVIISNGGCNSLTLAFIQQVNPELVVFSGKPCYETLERIKLLGINYLSTDVNGDIVIASDGINYEKNYLKIK